MLSPGILNATDSDCRCLQFVGLSATRIIYIESFARVSRLSLSGKLLRPFVHRFLVQWPQLQRPAVLMLPPVEYVPGLLMPSAVVNPSPPSTQPA